MGEGQTGLKHQNSATEGLLGTLPRGENGLGWVQIQQKSLRWEEITDGSSVVTHEGLTTLAQPKLGWTVASWTWTTLKKMWGKSPATTNRINESRAQDRLECADIFTPTRHILQTIKQTWKLNSIHGLPAVAAPAFFQSTSSNDETLWDQPTELSL